MSASSETAERVLNTPDYLAVTETKEKSFAFRWNINKFGKQLQAERKMIYSPVFIYDDDGRIKYRWYLSVSTKEVGQIGSEEECEYISIHVSPELLKKHINVNLTIGILDHNENMLKQKSFPYNFIFAHEKGGWPCFEKISTLLDSNNHMLENDVLRIYCKIRINVGKEHTVITGADAEAEAKKLERYNDIVFDFQKLVVSSMFSDTSIQGPKKIMKAHKAILCSRSSVFQSMLFEGVVDNIIKIPDFDDHIICGMVQYIYSGKIYPLGVLEKRATDFLKIAEKYAITGLKTEAENILIGALSVENVASLLCLADECKALDLKAKAISFFNISKADVLQTEGYKEMLMENKTVFVDLYLNRHC